MEETVQIWSRLPIYRSINKGSNYGVTKQIKEFYKERRGVGGDGCPIPEVAVSYLALWMQLQRAFSAPLGL